jgi:cell division protein YceG involved in septum cleavage
MFSSRLAFRLLYGTILLLIIAAALGIGTLLKTKSLVFDSAYKYSEPTAAAVVEPFPVGVNSFTKTINVDPTLDHFFYETIANDPHSKDHWWNQVASVFASKAWFQNLASPISRIIVIWPGERKEEIAKNIGDVLGWNAADRTEFQQLIDASEPVIAEGKYFPGQYVAHRGATPADIQTLLQESFKAAVLDRYTPEVAAQVPLEDALIIASLLEREASDFDNMREISGVIWNRLFTDMPLQLDATLQYVKGSKPQQPAWWPVVRPADKFLKSPYNTYQNPGLPPAPIANPSAEAILAALNPVVTDCLYYFHTKNKTYHCSPTYEEHVSKLRAIYGRGS